MHIYCDHHHTIIIFIQYISIIKQLMGPHKQMETECEHGED